MSELFNNHIPAFRHFSHRYSFISNIKLKAKHKKKYELYGGDHNLVEFQRLRPIIKLQIQITYRNYLGNIQLSLVNISEFFGHLYILKTKLSKSLGHLTIMSLNTLNLIKFSLVLVSIFKVFTWNQ